MSRELPPTRRSLQYLTRRIDHIEHGVVIGYVPRPGSTGVRAAVKTAGARRRKYERSQALREQRKLVELGFLKILETGGSAEAKLTKNGAILALKDRIATTTMVLPEAKVCLVVFDIPEDVRTFRQSFRRCLRDAGFRRLQKSVWETRKDAVGEIAQLVKELGISKWVQIFVGNKYGDFDPIGSKS